MASVSARRVCPACGCEFVNQDDRVKTCSHACGARLMHVKKSVTTTGILASDVVNGANPRFTLDAVGQWWYQGKKDKYRTRAHVNTCGGCGKLFLVSIYHRKQAQCSKSCGQKVSYSKDPPRKAGVVTVHRGNWKGGRRVTDQGYVRIYAPDHPSTLGKKQKGVFEHRLVMEKMIGRHLKPHEQVHHKNGDRQDNRPENLELWVKQQPAGARRGEVKHCPTCTCGLH